MTLASVPAATARSAPLPGAGPNADLGRLVVSCVDGPGIVARVSAFLHRRGANIVQCIAAASIATDHPMLPPAQARSRPDAVPLPGPGAR